MSIESRIGSPVAIRLTRHAGAAAERRRRCEVIVLILMPRGNLHELLATASVYPVGRCQRGPKAYPPRVEARRHALSTDRTRPPTLTIQDCRFVIDAGTRRPRDLWGLKEMSDSLLRVVYLSRATQTIDEGTLQAILAGSVERNSRDGITGVLCAGRDHYLQVIEGCVGPVMTLYLRILADQRHCEPTLLSISLVDERLFGQWAMAHIEGSARSAFAQEIVLTETSLHQRSDRAVAILRRFVEELKVGAASVAGTAVTS